MTFQPKFADLVRVTTTSSGTGAIDLGPAVAGYAHFTDALSVGDRFYYCIQGVDEPAEREVGRGTLQAGATMAREPIGGAPTDFSAGAKTVALVSAAEWYARIEAASASGSVTPLVLADQATIVPDLAAGSNFTVTIAGHRTLGVPTGAAAGQRGRIRIVQDAAGGRSINFAPCWLFAGAAPALPSKAGASLTLDYYVHDVGAIEVTEAKAASAPSRAILAPVELAVLSVGAANAIRTANPCAVTIDGAAAGSTSGNPAALAYTPTAADSDVLIATADSAVRVMVAAADPGTLGVAAAFSGGGCSFAGGKPDPLGGNAAIDIVAAPGGASRHLISYSATGRPTSANSSMEFWVSDPIGTAFDGFNMYDKLWFRFVDGKWQTGGGGGMISSAAILERRVTADGIGMTRFLYRGEVGKVNDSSFLDLTLNWVDTAAVPAGTHGFRVFGWRYIDGVAPIGKAHRAKFKDSGAMVGATTVRRWHWRGPFNDGTALYDMGTDFAVDVLLPDSFNPKRARKYRWIAMPKVEPSQNIYNGELTGNGSSGNGTNQGAFHQNLHNLHDVIFVCPSTQGWPWGGRAASGKHDHTALLGEALPRLMRTYFNGSSDPNDVGIMGYSKAAFAALYIRQMYPDVYGFAGCHDAPWGMSYPGYLVGSEFEDAATYNAYDPFANLAARKGKLDDRIRLAVSATSTFAGQYATLKTALKTNGIRYRDLGIVPVAHDYLAAWANPMAADLVAMMDGTLA